MQVSFAPIIVVTREDVNSQDTSSVISALNALIKSPEVARMFFEQVDLSFHGYNDTSEELFEIAEVRNYVHALDDKFPFWLYFLSKSGTGLQCIAYCFLPPFLTQAAKAERFPQCLDELLQRRWFPAMNQLCEWTGFSEQQIESLTDRSVKYLLGEALDA